MSGTSLARRHTPVAVVGAALLAASTLGALPASAAPAAPSAVVLPATTVPGTCPALGDMPGLSDRTDLVDANVALFVGGSWTVGGNAAESEGVHVILGDVTVDKSNGFYAIGVVGLGSGIVPPRGAVMLAVGGDVDVAAGEEVRVGDRGVHGQAAVGGTVTGGLTAPGGGHVEEGLGAAAVAPWAGLPAALKATSGELASLAPTGTFESNGYGKARLAGDGTSTPQVFALTAEQLVAHPELDFTGIPTVGGTGFAPVVVNVSGSGSASMTHNILTINGERIENQSMGRGATALLWNFPETTDLFLGNGQEIGSVLAPVADATVVASTNGRLYVGGNLTSRGDVGNEHHNYPWTGGTGTFRCDTTVTPPEVAVPPAASVSAPEPSPEPSQSAQVTADAPAPSATPAVLVPTADDAVATPAATPENGTVSPGEPVGSVTPEETAATGDTGRLAHTGADLTALWVALGLLVTGGAVVLVARRVQHR